MGLDRSQKVGLTRLDALREQLRHNPTPVDLRTVSGITDAILPPYGHLQERKDQLRKELAFNEEFGNYKVTKRTLQDEREEKAPEVEEVPRMSDEFVQKVCLSRGKADGNEAAKVVSVSAIRAVRGTRGSVRRQLGGIAVATKRGRGKKPPFRAEKDDEEESDSHGGRHNGENGILEEVNGDHHGKKVLETGEKQLLSRWKEYQGTRIITAAVLVVIILRILGLIRDSMDVKVGVVQVGVVGLLLALGGKLRRKVAARERLKVARVNAVLGMEENREAKVEIASGFGYRTVEELAERKFDMENARHVIDLDDAGSDILESSADDWPKATREGQVAMVGAAVNAMQARPLALARVKGKWKVGGKWDGMDPIVALLWDSGANICLISEDIIDAMERESKVKLKVVEDHTVMEGAMGGTQKSRGEVLLDLEIDGCNFSKVPFLIHGSKNFKGEFQGILGHDFIKEYRVDFKFSGAKDAAWVQQGDKRKKTNISYAIEPVVKVHALRDTVLLPGKASTVKIKVEKKLLEGDLTQGLLLGSEGFDDLAAYVQFNTKGVSSVLMTTTNEEPEMISKNQEIGGIGRFWKSTEKPDLGLAIGAEDDYKILKRIPKKCVRECFCKVRADPSEYVLMIINEVGVSTWGPRYFGVPLVENKDSLTPATTLPEGLYVGEEQKMLFCRGQPSLADGDLERILEDGKVRRIVIPLYDKQVIPLALTPLLHQLERLEIDLIIHNLRKTAKVHGMCVGPFIWSELPIKTVEVLAYVSPNLKMAGWGEPKSNVMKPFCFHLGTLNGTISAKDDHHLRVHVHDRNMFAVKEEYKRDLQALLKSMSSFRGASLAIFTNDQKEKAAAGIREIIKAIKEGPGGSEWKMGSHYGTPMGKNWFTGILRVEPSPVPKCLCGYCGHAHIHLAECCTKCPVKRGDPEMARGGPPWPVRVEKVESKSEYSRVGNAGSSKSESRAEVGAVAWNNK